MLKLHILLLVGLAAHAQDLRLSRPWREEVLQFPNVWLSSPRDGNSFKVIADVKADDENHHVSFDFGRARAACEAAGGQLASFADEEELHWLAKTFVNASALNETVAVELFVGMVRMCPVSEYPRDAFRWIDGSSSSLSPELSPEENEDCTVLSVSNEHLDGRLQFSDGKVAALGAVCKYGATPKLSNATACGDLTWCQFGPNKCFKLATTTASFNDAELQCRQAFGGHLASIHSDEENNFLGKMATLTAVYDETSVLIGLNDQDSYLDLRWTDGTPTDYFNWAGNLTDTEPPLSMESCTALLMSAEGKTEWSRRRCDEKTLFICAKQSSVESTTVEEPQSKGTTPIGNCRAGWMQYGNRCFALFSFDSAENIQDAQAFCRSRDRATSQRRTSLASIRNVYEQMFVQSLLKLASNDGSHWNTSILIGLVSPKAPNKPSIKDDDSGEAEKKLSVQWLDEAPLTLTRFMTNELDELIELEAGSCFIVTLKQPWEWTVKSADDCNDKVSKVATSFLCAEDADPSETPHELSRFNQCRYDEFPYGDNVCYHISTNHKRWSDAELECENRGGNLVSFTDAYETGEIVSLIHEFRRKNQYVDNRFWIGLERKQEVSPRVDPSISRDESSSKFFWVDNWPTYVTIWGADEPRANESNDCVSLVMHNDVFVPNNDDMFGAHWEVDDCSLTLPFVCKRTSIPSPTIEISGGCPDDWLEGSSACYLVVTDGLEMATAEMHDCQRRNHSHLASFHSEGELSHLMKYIYSSTKKLSTHFPMFIGLQQTVDGVYHWVDGSVVDFIAWDPNDDENADDPKANKNRRFCTSLSADGLFVREICTHEHTHICMLPKREAWRFGSWAPMRDDANLVEQSDARQVHVIIGVAISAAIVVALLAFAYIGRDFLREHLLQRGGRRRLEEDPVL